VTFLFLKKIRLVFVSEKECHRFKLRAEGLSTYVIEETAKALRNTKTIEAKFAEQISTKLIKKVQVEITSFQDLRVNWIGPLRNLVAEINSRTSWNNPNEIWMKENTFKIQLNNTERKMGDMLDYHKQADSEVILLFLDVQIRFHKEAYLSYKEFKENIVQNRGEEMHKNIKNELNKSSRAPSTTELHTSRESLSNSRSFTSPVIVPDAQISRSRSGIFRRYEPHPPNQVFTDGFLELVN